MHESTTVGVGLDVHARSVRLGAARADDELLEERTLPYDEEAVERALRRWPLVRCRYEAARPGSACNVIKTDTYVGDDDQMALTLTATGSDARAESLSREPGDGAVDPAGEQNEPNGSWLKRGNP